jgi:hypothetical protein
MVLTIGCIEDAWLVTVVWMPAFCYVPVLLFIRHCRGLASTALCKKQVLSFVRTLQRAGIYSVV